MKRTLCVGDIHGGLKALHECFKKSSFDIEKDQLIFLGDYIDGWGESAQLIEFLIQLQNNCFYKPVFLKGNHDEWCNKWLKTGVKDEQWLNQGGLSTVKSYEKTTNGEISYEHLMFFYRLHNYYIDDQNRGFVHGGFTSKKGLGHEPYESNYYWDRDLWQLALVSHRNLHEVMEQKSPQGTRFLKHKEIFIGHTATENWNCKPHYPEYNDINQTLKNGPITIPMNRCNVWNLDTGAGFGGKLTIMDIDTKQYWQSEHVKNLYPEENGR